MKPMSSPASIRSTAAPVVTGVLALASLPALAQPAAAVPAVHDLWIAHGLWGFVVGLVGFLAGRNWATAGIVVVAALAYAAARLGGPDVPAEVLALADARYPFHVQATALFVPLMAIVGIGARRTYFANWSLREN